MRWRYLVRANLLVRGGLVPEPRGPQTVQPLSGRGSGRDAPLLSGSSFRANPRPPLGASPPFTARACVSLRVVTVGNFRCGLCSQIYYFEIFHLICKLRIYFLLF